MALTSAERQAASRRRRNPPRPRNPPMTNAERQRRFRARIAAARVQIQPVVANNITRSQSMSGYWERASIYFNKEFKDNPFGYSCNICDRLWFKKDLRKVLPRHLTILEPRYGEQSSSFAACANCFLILGRRRLPTLSTVNGFTYPDKPNHLPPLDAITTRLISPRLPFMAIRRLRRDGSYGIIGQVINVPVDVNNMVKQLPRNLDDDHSINICIKRKLIHKSPYLKGHVKKRVIRSWLEYLVQQPLYRHYNITIDWSQFDDPIIEDPMVAQDGGLIDPIQENDIDAQVLQARQQTLLWNEENVLDIAPGQNSRPLNVIFDHFAEELSFPQIYYGVGRFFDPQLRITPYMIANSEIRRKDRRGVTPEHVLYMAMKILRLRVVDSIQCNFRCVRDTENVTVSMLNDRAYLDQCIERNLSFLKSIPNSAQYWSTRKKDLFAMLRQLGKPTAFLTLSANEINWPELLTVLNRLSDNPVDPLDDPLLNLDRSKRSHLVNEDPVTCAIYFHKLTDVILKMISSKGRHNPFGKYRVVDYFQRIEFQHRGSPHTHILLWLENDPKEEVSENMPLTIQLVTDLCSVSRDDTLSNVYDNQMHKHTFTCTKRGETSCRFNIPYWPIKESRVLLPMASDDGRLPGMRLKAKKVRQNLENKVYDSIDSFLADNSLSYSDYLALIRSTLNRPSLLFRRNMSEISTNTFHPWLSRVLQSNMDLQFILEPYSCAAYVVDYINKSNRGAGDLHREIIKLNESHPEMTYEKLLRTLGSKILNTVELSAQEAAWYLLRQPMSHASRDTIFIPTCWPSERQKAHKRRDELALLDPDSTDVWTKSIIQKYEDRPADLKLVCLADFAALYSEKRRTNRVSDLRGNDFEDRDVADNEMEIDNIGELINHGPNEDESIAIHRSDLLHSSQLADDNNNNILQSYSRRRFSRIIRYRNYDSSDIDNFKREMVTLYIPFDNEQADILDRNRFLLIYDEKIDQINEKRHEYENASMEELIQEYRQLMASRTDNLAEESVVAREVFVGGIIPEGEDENFDDFNQQRRSEVVSMVRVRDDIMSKQSYCELMRTTNDRQRELILEVIHRINTPTEKPIQIFFTGPAGCGKTYVLKLLMETFNRFSHEANSLNNAYVACASTGKAAVNLGGTTVHSAFHITQSRRVSIIPRETLQSYRQLFVNVKCIIIDEVSMIGSDILHKVNQRLQEITGQLDDCFGGMNMIFCGDFRQLPPVNATPVYKSSRNHLQAALLWQSLDFFGLEQVMRQNDVIFSSILTKIGNGQQLSITESELIQSRFRTHQWCDENLSGVVRLYHQNHLVDSYNTTSIKDGIDHVANDLIIGYRNNGELITARTKLHKMSIMESAGLPYTIKLAVGYPYMITSNIDVEDLLVNGAIGTLKFIETMTIDNPLPGGNLSNIRVWLEFSNTKTGAHARIRSRASVACRRGEIDESWTPIAQRVASINLGGSIRCKRMQLPLTPACAITIHKSQGGTFDKAVIQYEKNQQNQLVYVALSRVTSIEGLFLVNAKNDFNFYHKNGSSAPSVREIRDEYARLSRHPLDTVHSKVKKFVARNLEDNIILICTINSQSLVAHSHDIQTDAIIKQSDVLSITETWMDNESPVTIDGFEHICGNNQTVTNRGQSGSSRTAGGVAIYKAINSVTECQPFPVEITDGHLLNVPRVGDLTLAEIILNQCKIILCTVYIHPRSIKENIKLFFHNMLRRFTIHIADSDIETPMIITGDFNVNIDDDDWIVHFIRQDFGLDYVPSPSSTTLGNTRIDLTFARGLNVSVLPYVCYFSYHRPLFNRISFRMQ